MALYHILILALVQGVTEFLPISSSGHLVLASRFMEMDNNGLAMDVAVHVGTLLAVMLYFWRDMWQMSVGVGRMVVGRGGPQARLVVNVVIGTLPILVIGYAFYDHIAAWLHNVELIAWTTIGFGIALWLADKTGMTFRRVEHLDMKGALIIGLAQVLALAPGTSRSGITMTAARFMGFERPDAARFSMLLSIPTIAGAGLLTGYEVHKAGDLLLEQDMILAAGFSFVAGLAAIAAMMAWLKHAGFGAFVLYRLLLGGMLLYWVYDPQIF